ncbi:MAG: Fur family transcriptional regulator [Dehalococcoidia bacterium]
MARRSKQRDTILKVLRSTTSHPTVDWIYDRVREDIPNVSLGTVYRNLNQLKQEGVIQELNVGSGPSHYDGTPENHYHFRCVKCGRVFDVDKPVNHELEREVEQKSGFRVLYHQVEFYGLCPDCQKSDGGSF